MKKILIGIICILSPIFSIGQDFIKDRKYAGDPLFDFVYEWWKTPYRYGGQSKRGIDCSAFTQRLAKEVYGKPLLRTASQQYKSTKRIPKDSLQDGDLVFFKIRSRRYVRGGKTYYTSGWHVGVYLTKGWFIHSSSNGGVKFSNLEDPFYKRIYYSAGRFL
jgi:lipoprotein Spr